MKFSEMVVQEQYKPNDAKRAGELAVKLYRMVEKEILSGNLKASFDGSRIKLSEIASLVGGTWNKRDDVVIDWNIEEEFKLGSRARLYGPKKARVQSKPKSEQGSKFKEALDRLNALGDSNNKQEILSTIEGFIGAYRAYSAVMRALPKLEEPKAPKKK
ncbi:MAG: hypothetical protein QXT97_02610 [Candidatus Diapherotrites archaeon]